MEEFVHADKKKELIRKQPCFTQLTDEEVTELAPFFIEKKYTAGEKIVTEGDLVDSVFLIVDGIAEVQHVRIEEGQTQIETVAKLGPEMAIGLNEKGFYSISGVRTATVVALTDMLLLRLSVAAFHGFALTHSHVNQVMRDYAAQTLR